MTLRQTQTIYELLEEKAQLRKAARSKEWARYIHKEQKLEALGDLCTGRKY